MKNTVGSEQKEKVPCIKWSRDPVFGPQVALLLPRLTQVGDPRGDWTWGFAHARQALTLSCIPWCISYQHHHPSLLRDQQPWEFPGYTAMASCHYWYPDLRMLRIYSAEDREPLRECVVTKSARWAQRSSNLMPAREQTALKIGHEFKVEIYHEYWASSTRHEAFHCIFSWGWLWGC